MKNSLFTNNNGSFKLLSTVNDGSTSLYINGVEIGAAYWVGSGTYVYVDGNYTYRIGQAATNSGNWQLIQDDEYNYHFAKVKDRTTEYLDIFYPVGSYYETSNTVFNPNTEWGGTWELENGGLVHIGSGAGYSVGDTGGEETHTLTKTESGLPSHGHEFIRPTVSSSGSVTGGITGGSHHHAVGWSSVNRGSGSTGTRQVSTVSGSNTNNTSDTTHTHDLPNHTHTLTGGSVSDNTGADAASAHNNMQPYIVVNRWHRTA